MTVLLLPWVTTLEVVADGRGRAGRPRRRRRRRPPPTPTRPRRRRWLWSTAGLDHAVDDDAVAVGVAHADVDRLVLLAGDAAVAGVVAGGVGVHRLGVRPRRRAPASRPAAPRRSARRVGIAVRGHRTSLHAVEALPARCKQRAVPRPDTPELKGQHLAIWLSGRGGERSLGRFPSRRRIDAVSLHCGRRTQDDAAAKREPVFQRALAGRWSLAVGARGRLRGCSCG